MREPAIRVGLPYPGGSLAAAVRELDAPALMSANALARRWPRRDRWNTPFPGFRPPPASMHGLDVALDSAGFVVMALHGGFPWAVARYYDLVESFDWAWHASMDCCCEPEIASDADAVSLRIAETARLYGLCRQEARIRGLADPVPILQGWTPDDYARCLDLMPIADWPALVGIGSMCRRDLAGLVAVVDRLDAILPRHVGFHLFGVKSAGIDALRGHPRIVSVDSAAWDFAARQANGGRCPRMPTRLEHMRSWYRRQVAGRPPRNLDAIRVQGAGVAETAVGASRDIPDAWMDLVAGGEIEASDVDLQRVMQTGL